MTADEVLAEIRPMAKEGYKRLLLNHGVREPVLGVSVASLKTIQKRVKRDHGLALALYDTGVYDAMYLAGLIADPARMTRKDLRRWAAAANCAPLCGYTVAWVAAESPDGWATALEWIDSDKEREAVAGWATLSGIVSTTADDDLDLPALKRLLRRVGKSIHKAPDAVRYQMNGFVIAVGCHVRPLTDLAMETAELVGPVSVDVGDTACKVPFAPDYIRKARQRGTIGRKRKHAGC